MEISKREVTVPKLLRRWWTNTYDLEPQVKIKNQFQLAQHEGFFTDENELIVNGVPVIAFEAGMNCLAGVIEFTLYDKPYELRFNYSMWSGNPRSIIILQSGRILAQYGDTSAMTVTQTVAFEII